MLEQVLTEKETKKLVMRKVASLMKVVVLLLFIFSLPAFGQSQTVSGTVLAEDDSAPLIGVTVSNKKTIKKLLQMHPVNSPLTQTKVMYWNSVMQVI